MSKITAALLLVLAFALLVPPAAAPAGGADRNIVALQRQVRALQKQVKTLNRRVKTLEAYSGAPFLGSTCQAALTADLFQGTWAVIEQVAGRSIFGPQVQVNDYGNCAFMREPSVPRPPVQVPPSISIFNPLMQWLHVPLG
jgi:type II secretory pathway component PulM